MLTFTCANRSGFPRDSLAGSFVLSIHVVISDFIVVCQLRHSSQGFESDEGTSGAEGSAAGRRRFATLEEPFDAI